jgi:hypothetical protein
MAQTAKDPLLEEMVAIKKLLMLQLLAAGYKQKHLAATLGVSEGTLSGMLPKGIRKEILRGSAEE